MTSTSYVVVSSVCRAGAGRIEELEKENKQLSERNCSKAKEEIC